MAPRISLRHVRSFLAVAAQGGFTAAAREQGVTQSSLTADIRHIEDTIGVKLFDRTTRRVELSPQGLNFLPIARRLISDFDSALSDLAAQATGNRGHVVVAGTLSTLEHIIGPTAAAFIVDYPMVKLTLRLMRPAEAQARVLAGDVDLALINPWSDESELLFEPALRDSLGVLCRPGHPLLALGRPLAWRDLNPYNYLAVMDSDHLMVMLRPHPLLAECIGNPVHEIAVDTIYSTLLTQSDTFSLVPALVARLHAPQELAYSPLHEPLIERELCFVTRKNRDAYPAVARFIQAARHAIEKMEPSKSITISRATQS